MRRLAASMLLAFACAWPAALHAQAGTRDDQYSALIASALKEYQLGHFSEARAFFAQAHELEPSARTLRGLGLTCYELRSYVEAIEFLQQAIASRVKPLTAAMRSEAARTLEQAQRFVARVRLSLEPQHARVKVDARPARPDAQGVLLLDPGAHQLSFEADGYAPGSRSVHAESGDELELEVELTARGGAPAAPPESSVIYAPEPDARTAPAAEPGDPGGPGAGPWILIGVSGAVAIGGGVLLAIALGDIARVENAQFGSRYSDVLAAEQRAPWLSAVGIAMLAAGVAGAGVGIYWVLSDSSSDAGSARVRLGPSGVAVEGSF